MHAPIEDRETARVPPTFSTLPLGPLAGVVLFLTQGDLAEVLRTNRETRDSELDSDEFWRERCCSVFGRHVRCIEGLDKNIFRELLEVKRHAVGFSGPRGRGQLQQRDQLLLACIGASSQDNEDEAPELTLRQSPCARVIAAWGAVGVSEGQLFQTDCGCVFVRKCYWSSEPSPVADRNEWLHYELVPRLAVVSAFTLTPYTSFWQPKQPTYNPVEACFQLSHPEVNRGEPYYESPRYRVDSAMTCQKFVLPEPILSLGGRAKIILLGMAQRQTLGSEAGETANHYHICISHAALVGAVLLSCQIAGGARESPRPRTGAAVATRGVSALAVGGRRGLGVEASAAWNPKKRAEDARNMRIRRVMVVNVQRLSQLQKGGSNAKGNPRISNPSLEREAMYRTDGRGYFHDTPCLEVLEEYTRTQTRRTMEEVRLTLLHDPEREFRTDAALGEYAVNGRVDLVDVWGDVGDETMM